MPKVDLTSVTLIPTQEKLKKCTGRRMVGKIVNGVHKGYDYTIKYDDGKQIIEIRGKFRKE